MLKSGGDALEQPLISGLHRRVPQEENLRILPGQSSRLSAKVHADLVKQVICLAMIAPLAGHHLILPRARIPAPGYGDNVINGEVIGLALDPAILADALITQQQVAPIGMQHTLRHTDVADKPHHHNVLAQMPSVDLRLDHLPGLIIHKSDPLLAQKNNQLLTRDYVQGLE